MKKRLRAILGKAYDDFMTNLGMEDEIGYDDGSLIIAGCASGFCETYESIMVMDVAGKSIHCAILEGGKKFRTYGEKGSTFIPTTFMDQIRLRETNIR